MIVCPACSKTNPDLQDICLDCGIRLEKVQTKNTVLSSGLECVCGQKLTIGVGVKEKTCTCGTVLRLEGDLWKVFSIPADTLTLMQRRARHLQDNSDQAKKVLGLKHDAGKLPYELMPWSVIDGISAVQRFGAKKYAPNSWQHVKNGRLRYMAAAFRHMSRIMQGERYDPESGLPHIDHALCSLMYAAWIDQQHVKRHKK